MHQDLLCSNTAITQVQHTMCHAIRTGNRVCGTSCYYHPTLTSLVYVHDLINYTIFNVKSMTAYTACRPYNVDSLLTFIRLRTYIRCYNSTFLHGMVQWGDFWLGVSGGSVDLGGCWLLYFVYIINCTYTMLYVFYVVKLHVCIVTYLCVPYSSNATHCFTIIIMSEFTHYI